MDSYNLVTSLWLFIFEKWCKCTFKNLSAKKTQVFLFVFDVWKVTDENMQDPLVRGNDPWIRIPIRTKTSWIRNTDLKKNKTIKPSLR